MLDTGEKVTRTLFERLLREELASTREEIGAARYDNGNFELASRLFSEMSETPEFVEFLTLPAYERLS